MDIRLERADFFTGADSHTFTFRLGGPAPSGVLMRVAVENVGNGLEAQWDEAHLALLSVLEEATAEARRLLAARTFRGAGGSPPAGTPENP